MLSDSQKFLAQIAFNLLLIILLLVVLIAVLRDLFSPSGNLIESLFVLVIVGIVLFIGIGFLFRLIRESRQKE